VKPKEKLSSPTPVRAWTRPEHYVGAMALKRSFRHARRARARTQPERPRLLLSTVPFLAVFALLAVLSVAMMILAFPGNQPAPRPKQQPPKELGTANRGWFEEAQKDMHR